MSRELPDPVPTAASIASIVRGTDLDSAWSRVVPVRGRDGTTRQWHLLERRASAPGGGAVLCLHGNPTWSYLWSRLLRELDETYRVIAPDQLSMGMSEQVGARTYRERIADVIDLLDSLDITEPIWVVGHDWGGAIAMGLAVHHPDRVRGLFLANTGIAIPQGRRAPKLIRLAAAKGVHRLATERTSLFVRGTSVLPGLGLTRAQRRGLRAPYRHAHQRSGVAGFVADVPFDARHRSSADIAEVADRLCEIEAPTHLVFGTKDPVFDETFAGDLLMRFNNATLHHIVGAGHLSVLETSIAPMLEAAISTSARTAHLGVFDGREVAARAPIWAGVVAQSASSRLSVSEPRASVDGVAFARCVGQRAVALQAAGIGRGERVSLLVPPGIEMLSVLYALWRIGAVPVVADKGLGMRGLRRALRSAQPTRVIGTRASLFAARMLRWVNGAQMVRIDSIGGPDVTLAQLDIEAPSMDDLALIAFTSGATGPAKGVRYTHGQLCAQRDALAKLYAIEPTDSLVAAFAPFAVFGPALGISTGLVDIDPSTPAKLTATKLRDACIRANATLVFASPSALANVARTAGGVDVSAFSSLRLVLSAGAPVPLKVLAALETLCPNAELRTPYGMTEVLPVADISLTARRAAGVDNGVCVGTPVDGCLVRIDTLGEDNTPAAVGVCGEVVVSADWMSAGYDHLWYTEHLARALRDGRLWHRTGDLGHVDAAGRLWIEGRVVHAIETARGVVSPVPLEIQVEAIDGVERAAAVGIGPRGCAQVVIVIEPTPSGVLADAPTGLASNALAAAVRAAVHIPIAAVWVQPALPVDIRHNAKVDRTALSRVLSTRLAGGDACEY